VSFLSDAALERLRRAADLPDTEGTRYRIDREIGRGGMGTVYAARDVELDRDVALKVISVPDPDAADRMLREARIVARLEHPGIVPVHDAGRLPDGRVYYAMKLVRGRRLDALGAGPLPERLRIFVRICEAVAFAHSHGVVHRDLKPENVMLGAFGEVLVLDWGVAKLLAEASPVAASAERSPLPPGAPAAAPPPPARSTLAGTVVGTAGYMAPEQAQGRVDAIDARTDVYALGAILRFLLSSSESASPPPRPLQSVCARAMAVSPASRYAGAEEIAREIERYLDGARVLAHRETAAEKAGRLYRRFQTPIVLVLTYLAVRSLLLLFLQR
jgi:serine/threonine protein kinase